MALPGSFANWLTEPRKIGVLYGLARRFKPIVRVGDNYFVFRHSDVEEVLRRNDVFSVGPYGSKMTEATGRFILGMDDTLDYGREAEIVRGAIRKDDVGRIRNAAAALASTLVAEATAVADEIDVVTTVAERVPPVVMGEYYGLADPEPGTLLRWFEAASSYIFNFSPNAEAERKALDAGEKVRKYFDARIDERRREVEADREVPDDLLTRLLRHGGLDAEGIRRTLAGLFLGSMNAPIGSFVRALETLLGLPGTERAALHRAAIADDREYVRRCLAEAARFDAFPPIVYRRCEWDYVLGRGTRHERLIPRGKNVVTVLASASLDPKAVPEPRKFQPGRAGDEGVLFGYGQHFCVGKHIGQVLHTEMALPLLRLRNLRPAKGRKGRPVYGDAGGIRVGAYPRRFVITFDR